MWQTVDSALSLMTLVFPRLLLPLLMRRSFSAVGLPLRITVVFLLSSGCTGLIFTAARDLGILTAWLTRSYLVPAWIVTLVLAARWLLSALPDSDRHLKPPSRSTRLLFLAVAGPLAILSTYLCYLWPPPWWDNLLYHLPLAKVSADGSYRWYLSWSDSRFAWILEGFPQNFELSLSPFFSLGSPHYHIVPPAFALAAAVATYSLSLALTSGRHRAVVSMLVLVTTPAYILHASQFYVDLPLTAYVTGGLALLVQALRNRHEGLISVSAALFGFGGLVKLTGVALALLAAGLLAIYLMQHRWSCRRHGDAFRRIFRGRALWLATGVLVTVLSFWLVKKLLWIDVPPYPTRPDVSLGLQDAVTAVRLGLRSLFFGYGHPTGLPPIVWIAYLICVIRHLLSRTHRPRPESLLNAFVVSWMFLAPIGLFFVYRYPAWFGWLGRFLLPVYPVIAVLAVNGVADILERIAHPVALSARVRTAATTAAICIAAIGISGMVRVPGLPPKVGRISRTFVPLHQTGRMITAYTGSLQSPATLSTRQKMIATYGVDLVRTWEFINAHMGPEDILLTEDNRIYYLEPLTFDGAGLPTAAPSVPQVRAWLLERDVDFVLETDRIADFETRCPALAEVLRDDFELAFRAGDFTVYRRLPRGPSS